VYRLSVTGRFAAAHNLRHFKGRCESLHGHNWKVEVVVEGRDLDQADLLLDFGELKRLLNLALDQLDHRHLNQVPPFDQRNPSSEMIAKHLYETIAAQLPPQVKMAEVSTWESEDSRATYLG